MVAAHEFLALEESVDAKQFYGKWEEASKRFCELVEDPRLQAEVENDAWLDWRGQVTDTYYPSLFRFGTRWKRLADADDILNPDLRKRMLHAENELRRAGESAANPCETSVSASALMEFKSTEIRDLFRECVAEAEEPKARVTGIDYPQQGWRDILDASTRVRVSAFKSAVAHGDYTMAAWRADCLNILLEGASNEFKFPEGALFALDEWIECCSDPEFAVQISRCTPPRHMVGFGIEDRSALSRVERCVSTVRAIKIHIELHRGPGVPCAWCGKYFNLITTVGARDGCCSGRCATLQNKPTLNLDLGG